MQITEASQTLLVAALCGLIGAFTAYVLALAGRVQRNAETIKYLSNGGGTDKIDSRLRDHGLIPPISPSYMGQLMPISNKPAEAIPPPTDDNPTGK